VCVCVCVCVCVYVCVYVCVCVCVVCRKYRDVYDVQAYVQSAQRLVQQHSFYLLFSTKVTILTPEELAEYRKTRKAPWRGCVGLL
jgi:hypothetical protein